MSALRTGADCGGTFTDVVASDGTIAKVPSDPLDPSVAVAGGLAALGAESVATLAHGTTVATNAVLERRGATVALATTEGFADVIEIARQDRPSLYDHFVDRPPPLVERRHRLEVRERVAPDGTVVVPLDVDAVPDVPEECDAVAVCLLHSDLHPAHERDVAQALRHGGHDVSVSCEVAPEFREYERTVTTAVNAYVRPVCGDYLERISDLAHEVSVMTSSGGLADVDTAARFPARLLLSGPAGGVAAATAFARAVGYDQAVSFDMGGTSTDVCLIRDGRAEPAGQRHVAGLPVRLPSLDIHTIGAGGGSIAAIDPGGALVVGPRSAGARPGPACYGHGGTEPTVTDADLVAGRISTGASFGGLRLDADAAAAALASAGVSAEGVLAVVDANMERALRAVTIGRGVDPRDTALVAFGGAGPLHAAALAEALDFDAVVVPPRAGVLSAVGMLASPRQADLVASWGDPLDHDGARHAAADLLAQASEQVGEVAVSAVAFDCRYVGQSHELTVDDPDHFGAEHQIRNGYTRHDVAVEVVAVRATARSDVPLDVDALPVPTHRGSATSVSGPVAIAEPDCSIWVPDGWRAEPGPSGCLILRRGDRP